MTRTALMQIVQLVSLVAATTGCYAAAGNYDSSSVLDASAFADPVPADPAQQTPGPPPRVPDPVPRVYNPATNTYEPAPLVYNPATNSYEAGPQGPAPRHEEGEHYGPEKGDWELLLGGTGSNDHSFDAGNIGFSGSIGYFLTNNFELALRQNFNWSDVGNSTYIATTRAAIDYHFDLDRVYPFIGVNLGYVYGDNVDDTWEGAPELGLKWFVKPDTFIYGMAEYQFFFDNTSHIDNGFNHGIYVYSIGIGFTF